MKLYTRTGDDGTTGLFGGERVQKDHPRIQAIGAVDELNAAIGLAEATSSTSSSSSSELFDRIFSRLQSRLFDIGADLATPQASKHEAKISRISSRDVEESERWIDEVDSGNVPMSNFVLPGGTELAARLHLARTICRRAERLIVHLGRSEQINPQALIYINRVSDLLFAMARRANKDADVADVPWMPGHK
ncbi:MAG: cob(I)yrinic acid a,c-diamide adenosyltransferase [Phycisphaerales bacterium]|nr:cob(I)yrinic acid a,c-diamide adenosyltransferase [Phycisphaerales bacterium]MCI0674819.1 cob(I)yrinic acid a,c-diamide adenosyltransferase [Phycisphaerales bacterium]